MCFGKDKARLDISSQMFEDSEILHPIWCEFGCILFIHTNSLFDRRTFVNNQFQFINFHRDRWEELNLSSFFEFSFWGTKKVNTYYKKRQLSLKIVSPNLYINSSNICICILIIWNWIFQIEYYISQYHQINTFIFISDFMHNDIIMMQNSMR